jgi:hypothetical protein
MLNSKTLVIGNGESRQGLDLNNLTSTFTTVGCNAIHRDVTVDHLVCCDQRMVLEAIKNPNRENTVIYTRSDWSEKFSKFKIQRVPDLPYTGSQRWDQPFHWGSGGYALLVGAGLSHDIHIVGFDLVSSTGTVNNLYKGTNNYAKADHHPVDPTYWIYQTSMVFKSFPDKYFTVYNYKDWAMPESWKLANVVFKNIDTLTANTVY